MPWRLAHLLVFIFTHFLHPSTGSSAQHECLSALRSWPTQFVVLLRRAMLGQLRNPTDTTSRLFLSTWVGVLAGA